MIWRGRAGAAEKRQLTPARLIPSPAFGTLSHPMGEGQERESFRQSVGKSNIPEIPQIARRLFLLPAKRDQDEGGLKHPLNLSSF